jgi:hypothetical protein
MTFQIIDGVRFVNGVQMDVETIPEPQIEESLATLTIEIENKKQSLDRLLNQRDEVIVHAYKHGFSAIKLSNLVKVTRQRIYDVINKYKEEEE